MKNGNIYYPLFMMNNVEFLGHLPKRTDPLCTDTISESLNVGGLEMIAIYVYCLCASVQNKISI